MGWWLFLTPIVTWLVVVLALAVFVIIAVGLVSLPTCSHVHHFRPNALEVLLVVVLILEGFPSRLVLGGLAILSINVEVASLGYRDTSLV